MALLRHSSFWSLLTLVTCKGEFFGVGIQDFQIVGAQTQMYTMRWKQNDPWPHHLQHLSCKYHFAKAALLATKWLAPLVQTSEPFQTALQWCLFPWLRILKCPDCMVFIYPCTVYKTNSSCQTMLFNLFILKRHMTHFSAVFICAHLLLMCSPEVLLGGYNCRQ